MIQHGFVRVAAGVPCGRIADCTHNAQRILGLMRRAEAEGVAVLALPELSLTGYTCGDLFPPVRPAARRLEAPGELVHKSLQAYFRP